MALADILQQVNALLPVTVTVQVGAEHLSEHVAPPRVLWVPLPESFEPARNTRWARRPIATRVAKVACHVWAVGSDPAKPTAAAEDLVEQVYGAIHSVAYGAYELPKVAGFQHQDGSEITRLGRLYVFTVGFKVPVLERERTVLAECPTHESVLAELDEHVHILGPPLPVEEPET